MFENQSLSLVFSRKTVNYLFFEYSKYLIRMIRCAPTFECINENSKYKKLNEINMCTNIERVIPQTISLHSPNNKVKRPFSISLFFVRLNILV
jgi:hypothetical protein